MLLLKVILLKTMTIFVNKIQGGRSVTGQRLGVGLPLASLRVLDIVQERFHNASSDDFESTFIKDGDSETRKGLGRRSSRSEPRWSCFASLRSQRKGGLGNRFKW